MNEVRESSERALILVADDDPDIRALVTIQLERAGYRVVEARDGEEALSLARTTAPDLLVLDVGMPSKDGLTVCRELGANGPLTPPVIFLTAQAQTNARVTGLDAGAVDYITKPFQPAELRARVGAALRTKALLDALATHASTDPVTGLLNRRTLEQRAEELFALARRHGRPLSCLMLDLDRFKEINDSEGHAAGDRVLRFTAGTLRELSRLPDVVARYGGDEFAVVLPETRAEGATGFAERVRGRLADAGDPVRVSIGVAELDVNMTLSAELFAAADAALYRAKRLGRSRVAS